MQNFPRDGEIKVEATLSWLFWLWTAALTCTALPVWYGVYGWQFVGRSPLAGLAGLPMLILGVNLLRSARLNSLPRPFMTLSEERLTVHVNGASDSFDVGEVKEVTTGPWKFPQNVGGSSTPTEIILTDRRTIRIPRFPGATAFIKEVAFRRVPTIPLRVEESKLAGDLLKTCLAIAVPIGVISFIVDHASCGRPLR